MFDEHVGNRQENPADGEMQAGKGLALEQANPVTRSIVARLGYPCRIFSTEASYEEVMEAYGEARVQGQREGYTPLLVPADDILEEYLGILEGDGYVLEDILKTELESGEEFLKMRFNDYTDDEECGSREQECIDRFEGEVVDCFTAFRDYHTSGIVETILLKVPTTKPWELVAYVPFGGWNDCPSVEEMMAVCKYWYEKYGAVPVTISHDVMEMQLPQPVAAGDSMQVAKEHFAFTPDRVYQCTESGTLAEVAASIAASDIWYFWWD